MVRSHCVARLSRDGGRALRVAMMVLGGWVGSSVVIALVVGRLLAIRGSGRRDEAAFDALPANVTPITAARRFPGRTAAPAP